MTELSKPRGWQDSGSLEGIGSTILHVFVERLDILGQSREPSLPLTCSDRDHRSFGITVKDNSRVRGRRSVTSRWSTEPISRDEPVGLSSGRP